MVVGKVGSGKTSLLLSIMGETYIRSGTLSRRGSLAYVEQEPVIWSDSVRNNILFGLPLNEQRLQEVVRVCELEQDLTQLVHGLDTQIGERGINLSGGQRARISLARACYSDADIYLLDDPLSAVDPQVANNIFRFCIKGFLRKKAVLLATHRLSCLRGADEILCLEKGECCFRGKYSEFTVHKALVPYYTAEKREEGPALSGPSESRQERERRNLVEREEKDEG